MIPKEEVSDFFVTFTPDTPTAPSLSAVSFFTLTVTMPVLTTYATAQNLQISTDGTTWTNVATGLASLQVVPVTGLTDATLYYFRAVATNPYASASGTAASTTTLARLPDAPVAPTFPSVTTTTIDIVVPVLPLYTTSLNLQQSTDNVSFSTIFTGVTAGSTQTATGLTSGTVYYFRAVAVNIHGTTNGASASKATSGAIEDESNFGIQDENNLDLDSD